MPNPESEADMYSTRFSRLTNPDVMSMFTILRERKGIKKIPNKTIEYYTGDHTALSARKTTKLPAKPSKEVMEQL